MRWPSALTWGLCVAAAALAVPSGACTGTPSSTEGVSASAGVGAGGSGAGGVGGAGGGSASSSGSGGSVLPSALVDDGLVVRYYIDEAASGQTPTELVDAAPSPLSLPLIYTPEMSFVEEDGHRGIGYTAPSTDGRASILADGTKVQSMLEGSTTGTLEAVVRIQDVELNDSRLIHIGESSEGGWFSLKTESVNRFFVDVNDTHGVDWAFPLLASGRVVLHVVYDSGAAAPEDRVKGFVNGGRLPHAGGASPAQGEAITVPAGKNFVVGNREIGVRSIQGVIFYAAVYQAALSDADVFNNAYLLLDSDDTP